MAGLFDDVPDAKPGAQGLFDDVPEAPAATKPPKGFLAQFMDDALGIFRKPKSVMETALPAEPAVPFDFNSASRVARAVDDGVPLPLPRTIAGDQERIATLAAADADKRAGMDRRRFANENPVMGGLAAGSANALTGLANAPTVLADAFNNVTVNPVLRALGQEPLARPVMPGTETLQQLGRDYTAEVSKPGVSEAWNGDQFGTWLMSNLAQQAPQAANSLMAAYFPALRPALLPSMGAQAAGNSYAQGDNSGIAILKGGIEAGSELLPLGVFDRVSAALASVPDGARRTVLNEAGRRLMASGAALTVNGITGAIEESVAQVGGNAADRYLAGKNVGLFDDVDKATVLGAAGGSVLTAPQAAGTLFGSREEPKEKAPTLADYQEAAARVFGQAPAARAPQPAAPAPQPEPQAAPQPTADRQAIDSILGAIEAAVPTQQAPATQPVEATQPTEASAPTEQALVEPEGLFADLPDAPAASSQAQPAAPVQQPAPTVGATEEGAGATQPPQAAPIQQAAPATDAQQPSNIRPADVQQTPNDTQDDGPVGRDFTPISQGGKAFKTNREAKAARKLQPHLRVKKSKDGNGFILVPATAAQLAAAAQAAKRIGTAKTGSAGKPMSAHEFIIGKGGMDGSARADLVIDGNPRFGNRFLFAGKGKPGLTLDQAAELLAEAGYIKEESGRAAADIIKRSITSPQYTPEGWESIAQAEQEARFEDHLAAQQEQPSDPFTLDQADLDELGYTKAPSELQDEVRALRELADAEGIDTDEIMARAAQITENGTDEEFNREAIRQLTDARGGAAGVRREAARTGAEQGRQAAQRAGAEDGGLDDGARADQEGAGDTAQGLTDQGDQADDGMVREGAADYKDQTETPQFKRWSKGAPVVRMGDDGHTFEGGKPVVVEALHGTTADFTEFKAERANIESDLGGGFYFTNTPEDVGTNYAGKGPDLTSKLEQATERLEQELADDEEWADKSPEEIRAEAERQARQRWMDHDGMTMPVFVRFDNPVVIGGDGATLLRYQEPYNEELDEYGEPEGELVEFAEALRDVAGDFIDADADGAMAKVWEELDGDDTIEAGKLMDILAKSEGLQYATNEDGTLASKEILRLAFERMGFDGFIDTTAYDKFGPRKIKGAYSQVKVAGMQGMYRETVHFIAFGAKQIKSRLGNNGDFNPDDANITRERGTDQPDLFSQQLDLFLQAAPVETQAGPEVEAARKEAVQALRDIRDMGNPLAMALSTDLAARQRVSLVGQTARTPEEFATLAQVYRDPRFETFRVVFTNDSGKIVSQMGLTMRMPGATTAIMGGDVNEYIDTLMAAAENRGATGYYLLHNHPSGNPLPSKADETLTRTYAAKTSFGRVKFNGHVVIDTNKYALIDKNGKWTIEQKDFGQPDPYKPGEWAGEVLTGPADVMRLAKRLQVDNNTVTLIVTNFQQRVLGVTSIPARSLTTDKERNRLVLAKATLGMKGAKVVAVGRNFESLRATNGMVLDAVQVFSDGTLASFTKEGLIQGGAEVIDELRGTRVSPDTSPEFAYLREKALKENKDRNKMRARLGPQAREKQEDDYDLDFTQPAGSARQGDAAGARADGARGQAAQDVQRTVAGQPAPRGWARATSLRREDGPIAFFRGAQAQLTPEHFQLKALGYASGNPSSGLGVWSTEQQDEAGTYGPVQKLYLDIRKPKVYRYDQLPGFDSKEEAHAFREKLRAQGFDGIVVHGKGLGKPWYHAVAFDASQVIEGEQDDTSIVREEPPKYGDQEELRLGSANPDKFRMRDLLGFERDASGRRIWTAGRKGYEAGMAFARDYLGGGYFKVMDTKPREFRTMMRKFQADNYNAQQKALAIAKSGQGMPPELRTLLSDIIESEAAVGDNTPEGLTEIAARMSAAFESQAQELIELGMMDPNRKVVGYLPRVYRNPLIGKLQSKAQMMGLLNKVNMRIRGDRLKSRGMTSMVPPGRVKDMERLGWRLSSMPDGSPVPVDLRTAIERGRPVPGRFNEGQKVVMWRDYTKTEREEMGEVRDAFIRFAMGYVETQKDLAAGRLFKSISENRALASPFNPGGWVKVSDKEIFGSNGVKMYGLLAGMYVNPQVADQLKRAIQDNSAVLQAYDKALSLWKEGKTVWNPVAHGNNIVSNLFMAHFAGINFANPMVWRRALKEYRSKGKLYQEAIENGLLGTEFANVEIQNALMPELQEFMTEADVVASRITKMTDLLLKKKVYNPLSWPGGYRQFMQKAYEFEDQIFKLMVYIDRRQAGAEPDAAVDDAERYFFNYADVPEGIRVVQRVYSPFFSYFYKALPAVLHTAATRPDRMLMPLALLGGANWLAYSLLGDEGDEEEERKNLPEYMKGNTALGTPKMVRLPVNSPEGNPYFLDMSRRIPLGDIFDINNQTGGLPIFQPFMPGHPIIGMGVATFYNTDTFTGKVLVKKSDDEWEAAQKRAGYLYRQIVPNAAFIPGSYAWDKSAQGFASAFDKDMGPYTGFSNQGDKTKPWVAALDVTGVGKVRESDTKRNEDFAMSDIRKEMMELRANVASLGRRLQNKAITQAEYDTQVARQEKKMERLRELSDETR